MRKRCVTIEHAQVDAPCRAVRFRSPVNAPEQQTSSVWKAPAVVAALITAAAAIAGMVYKTDQKEKAAQALIAQQKDQQETDRVSKIKDQAKQKPEGDERKQFLLDISKEDPNLKLREWAVEQLRRPAKPVKCDIATVRALGSGDDDRCLDRALEHGWQPTRDNGTHNLLWSLGEGTTCVCTEAH